MKTFVTGFVVLALAVAIASAVPVPEDIPAAVVANAVDVPAAVEAVSAPVEETPSTAGTKQSPLDGITNFFQNLPGLPFSGQSAASGGEAPASPIASIQQAFSPVVNFIQDRFSDFQNAVGGTTTTQATKTETSTAAPVKED